MAHLSSVFPANDTKEIVICDRNFPSREQGLNVGPLAPEASALTSELHAFSDDKSLFIIFDLAAL